MLLEPVERYRARKAAAVRYGDREAAAEADLGLRAHKIAKAIKAGCTGAPLPLATVQALCSMLTGGDAA